MEHEPSLVALDQHTLATGATSHALALHAPDVLLGMLADAGGRVVFDSLVRRFVDLSALDYEPTRSIVSIAAWTLVGRGLARWEAGEVVLTPRAPRPIRDFGPTEWAALVEDAARCAEG